MEATGIYWIRLYSLLEASGIKVSLVNPKETKQKKGEKPMLEIVDGYKNYFQQDYSKRVLSQKVECRR